MLLVLAACNGPQREARKMVRRAERLFSTDPDSTVRLIDSVLRMPAYFEEGKRMDIALLQAEALFGDRNDREISPLMDDEFFDDKPFLTTSPELERAADYYARKKRYDKAAHAALYSGFVQQHYGEKTHAMQSFMDAEQYGGLVKDSLAVALAEYWMGKMLYDEGLKQEALVFFKKSDEVFGSRYVARAKVLNNMACCYLLCGQFDSTEVCLKHSLEYTQKDKSNQLRHKVLNNYAVLNRLQGNYDMALKNLQTIEIEIDSTEMPFLYLNKALVFVASNKVDSATCCFNNLKPFLLLPDVKEITKVSAYEALSRFSKSLGNDSMALQYREKHELMLFEVMQEKQEQSVFRIQQQYDYENLQNTLNRKIIIRHKIIIVISVLLLLSAAIILALQFRHKRMREAEKELKRQIDTMKQDLRETVKSSVMDEEIALRLRMILTASRTTKKAKDPQKEWMPLVMQVMNGKENHFEAARSTIEMAYPNAYTILIGKNPNLSETEAKVCLLSFSDLSNAEIAELLDLRQNTINQHRSTLRKKLNLKPDRMKEQLRDALVEKA